jgi:glycosyltransferase involved in cell wall biosynthesis/peptidoglycan/xylan/chitin deacetylase (PgdA/CDA1 family)
VSAVKVLHLIWALDLGGAERQVIEIVKGLDRSRFEPTVGCLVRKGQWGEDLEAEGTPVVDFAKRPGLDLALLLRLARFVRRGGFEIVHTHAFTAASWGRAAAAIARVPAIVAHEHSAFSLESPLRRLVDRMLALWTSRWVAVSETLARDLVRLERLPLPRLVVVRNGASWRSATPDAVRRTRRELVGDPATELLGTVGRLERRKGLEVLLEAFERLASRRPGLALALVGDGPLHQELEDEVKRRGISDRVCLPGRREDVAAVLGAFDVFALSSHTEGLSIALLEAALAGCPIVATDVGGNPEVVRAGRNGLLVPPRDPSALAEAVATLLDDRTRAQELGSEARRDVRQRFAPEAMVHAIESLYEDLLAPRDSPRAHFKRPPRAVSARRAVRRSMAIVSPRERQRPTPTLRILAYHRINDTHPGDRLSVHPLEFRRQMEHIAECGRPVLPLHEAVRRLKGEGPPLALGTLCLTFDDGYRDNLENAVPVLGRFGFPATIFLVTGRMGADATIDRYEDCCDRDRALTWEEAREVQARGHRLGGHGRRHRELAALDEAALRGEVFGCRDDLRAELRETPATFCYPRGSENLAVRQVVAEAGFEVGVTVYPGANEAQTDPLRLHRTEISALDDISSFRLKLRGAFDAWHRVWQRTRS